MARNNIHQFVAKRKAAMTEQLLPYDLGAELIGALEREFDDMLKGIDLDEEQRARLRETY